MNFFKRVAQEPPPKQLWLAIVWIPARVFDPTAEEIILTRYEIRYWSTLVILSDDRENLVACLGRAALVGVKRKDPLILAVGNGFISEGAKATEVDLHHSNAQFSGNLCGIVS